MHHIQKIIKGAGDNPIGSIKYAEAGALVPVGQLQFEVHLFGKEGEKAGEIRKIRTADVFIDWRDMKLRYPDDLGITRAVLLAERIIIRNPQNHEDLKEVVNSFAREFYEAAPRKSDGAERF